MDERKDIDVKIGDLLFVKSVDNFTIGKVYKLSELSIYIRGVDSNSNEKFNDLYYMAITIPIEEDLKKIFNIENIKISKNIDDVEEKYKWLLNKYLQLDVIEGRKYKLKLLENL